MKNNAIPKKVITMIITYEINTRKKPKTRIYPMKRDVDELKLHWKSKKSFFNSGSFTNN